MNICIISEETNYSPVYKVLFSDLLKDGNVYINNYLNETGVRKLILNILYKNKINYFLKGCFEKIIPPHFCLEDFLENNEDAIVVFLNGSLQKIYSQNNLNIIHEKYPKSSFVLLFVDSIFQKQAYNAYQLSKKNVFDLVYSFDKKDSIENDYIFTETPYSRIPIKTKNNKGVYFAGSDKGRAKMLDDIAGFLQKNNIEYDINIFGCDSTLKNIKKQQKQVKNYEDLLEDAMQYNCLLDIVQEKINHPAGLSLRVYEALAYNKILITNNINIFDFKYYDEHYMHYIEKSDQIDVNWLEEDHVDYKINMDISPLNWIKKVKRDLNRSI